LDRPAHAGGSELLAVRALGELDLPRARAGYDLATAAQPRLRVLVLGGRTGRGLRLLVHAAPPLALCGHFTDPNRLRLDRANRSARLADLSERSRDRGSALSRALHRQRSFGLEPLQRVHAVLDDG